MDILKLTPLPTHLMTELQQHYHVHDHGHLVDPSVLGRVQVMLGTGEMKVDAKLLATYPKVQMVCVLGESVEHIDLQALQSKNIALTSTPGVALDDVADLAMGLVLSVIRKIPEAHRFVRNADWVEGAFAQTRSLTGSRLGMVGDKALMKEIAKRAQGFKTELSYFDIHEDEAFSRETGARGYAQLLEMVKHIDVLVLCAQSEPGLGPLIDAQVIEALGPNAYVINVGNAHILDQGALLKALQLKKIAGAGMDVFEDEPRVSAEWRNLQNAVLTPHMASGTDRAQKAMAQMVLSHLENFKKQQNGVTLEPASSS